MIGEYAELRVAKLVDFGVFLEGDNEALILLPNRYVPPKTKLDDKIRVFIYRDSEDRIIATTLKPKAVVGEFATLKVKSVSKVGAFLDWGLAKDLLVPFSEQKDKMRENESYLVYVYLDETTGRIVATEKVERILSNHEITYQVNDEVQILIGRKTCLGYQVLIHNDALGLLYENEIFEEVKTGDYKTAYIKKIRDDGKIDVSFQQQGYANEIPKLSKQVLGLLEINNGFLPLNDKSSPGEISKSLQMSKKNFKKAIGNLYKQKRIEIKNNGIELTKTSNQG